MSGEHRVTCLWQFFLYTRYSLLYTILFVICYLSAYSQHNVKQISKLEFIGNHSIKQIGKSITFQTNTFVSDSTIQSWHESLLSIYAQNGFFWTTISAQIVEIKNQTMLKFSIQENNRAKTGRVTLVDNTAFSDLELSPIIKYNRYFSDKTLKSQIKNLLDFYSNNGYPFSVIEAQNFLLDDENHTISYQLKITEGPKVKINQMQFTRNQTKEYRLKQISGLKTNTYYSDWAINKGLQRIKKHNIDTKSYNVISSDTTYILQINVDERKFQEITGAITFQPDDKKFNGFFHFNLNNLFYTLRKLNLSWQHYARFTNFTLNYTDPWLLGFIINGNFTHNVYDTFYTKTNFDLHLAIPVLDYLSINFLTGYENINSGLTNLENYAAMWLGQGFKVETNNRSNIVYYLDFNTRFRTRKLNRNQLFIKTDLQNKLLIPLKNYTSLSLDWSFKNLYYKSGLLISDSIHIGGAKTLRGYRESEFATNRYLLTRNELVFLTNQSTNFFTFSDLALIREPNQYQLKLGYGIGLRAISKIGTIALDYGIPKNDNLLNGKIHLSFTNQF